MAFVLRLVPAYRDPTSRLRLGKRQLILTRNAKCLVQNGQAQSLKEPPKS